MNKFVSGFLVILCFSTKLVFCNTPNEVSTTVKHLEYLKTELGSTKGETDKVKSKMKKRIVKANIQHIEKTVFKKLEKSESRLEKYNQYLNNSQDDQEVQKWSKKIKATQKKINTFNETLLGIEIAKSQEEARA